MSVITSTQMMNIVEASKRAGYTNAAVFLGELAKKNDLLQYAPWYPSSDGNFHKSLKATRLGAGGFVKANGAIPKISSSSDPITTPITFYKADSIVDESVLQGAKDKGKARDSEDVANSAGFMNDWIYKLLYNTDTADGIEGFAVRRSAIDSKYTWNGGGTTGNQSSLYLMEFGERGFNFRYPAGTQPGFMSEDRGRHYIDSADGNGQNWAWIRHMEMIAGLEINDERSLMRMANIDVDATTIAHATFIKMKNNLPNAGKDAVAFCNRTVHSIIETAAYDKSNGAYSVREIEGFGPVFQLVGIHVAMMESILDTESVVS